MLGSPQVSVRACVVPVVWSLLKAISLVCVLARPQCLPGVAWPGAPLHAGLGVCLSPPPSPRLGQMSALPHLITFSLCVSLSISGLPGEEEVVVEARDCRRRLVG